MEKHFNVSGDCQPDLHYMVDLSERLRQIKAMVDAGQYFTINRARQYGKTTTLQALARYLKEDYMVVSLDFQMISASKFKDEHTFSIAFSRLFIKAAETADAGFTQILLPLKKDVNENREELELMELFEHLSELCKHSSKPVILMIDEVDSAANNQVFLDFLALLRGYYIKRQAVPTFWSVILAGVYDVKNLKRKLRSDKEHKMNSPWNIAVDFKGDMRFSQEEIEGMLKDYEEDHDTGMDTRKMAERIYDHTAGYPFLVSKICKIIDEEIAGSEDFPDEKAAWTYEGFLEADRILLGEKNVLFESMVNKLYDFPELKDMVYSILFTGKEIPYFALNQTIELAELFGFIKNDNGAAVIANRVFEMVFYKLFLKSPENKISVQ